MTSLHKTLEPQQVRGASCHAGYVGLGCDEHITHSSWNCVDKVREMQSSLSDGFKLDKVGVFPGDKDRWRITIAVFIPQLSFGGQGPLGGYGLAKPIV